MFILMYSCSPSILFVFLVFCTPKKSEHSVKVYFTFREGVSSVSISALLVNILRIFIVKGKKKKKEVFLHVFNSTHFCMFLIPDMFQWHDSQATRVHTQTAPVHIHVLVNRDCLSRVCYCRIWNLCVTASQTSVEESACCEPFSVSVSGSFPL